MPASDSALSNSRFSEKSTPNRSDVTIRETNTEMMTDSVAATK